MADSDKEFIELDEAVKRLPKGKAIHTIRQAGPCLLGADWDRPGLIEAMRKAPAIEVTGQIAQDMGHGLAIRDEHDLLYIATR